MSEDLKWVGTFKTSGYRYRMETPGSSVITKNKIPLNIVNIISIHDVTEYGTILKLELFFDGLLFETTLGHIKVIRNCCGKIITKYLEFVRSIDDNGVSQFFTLKRDKNGYVQEYEYNYIEAGYSKSNPEQKPTISIGNFKRIS